MTADDTDPSQWIRRYGKAAQAKTRLICLPHAGGSASFFHPLTKRFPEIDVVSLQYPGRQDRRREPNVGTIAEYADQITTVITSMPEMPTVFFGHSMGAAISFEVARRLETRGSDAPLSIIASGRRAPSVERDDDDVHLRDDNGIIAELKLLNGSGPALFEDEILRMALPAIRSDYRAIETYRCAAGDTVRCPITVLIGDSDPKVTLDEAKAWRGHTSAAFRLLSFSGGHFYLTGHQTAINNEISAELENLLPVR